MKATVYMISYLGKDEKIIRDRVKYIRTTFKYYNEVVNGSEGHDITVRLLAQAWPQDLLDEFVSSYDFLNLCCVPEPILPGPGRNMELREFYKSDDDFMFFSDDDLTVQMRGTGESVFNFYEKYMQHIPADAIAFKPAQYVNPFIKKGYAISAFYPSANFAAGFFLIKNIRKLYGKEVYFPENICALEDMAFNIELMSEGMQTYLCENPYLMFSVTSVLFNGDKEDRKRRNSSARLQIAADFAKKTGRTDLVVVKGDKFFLKKFVDTYGGQNSYIVNTDGSISTVQNFDAAYFNETGVPTKPGADLTGWFE